MELTIVLIADGNRLSIIALLDILHFDIGTIDCLGPLLLERV